ncbi:MAG: ATP-binding protein [Gammaproteobacteria bacterium]|nr:ATP-binding protein [Gammaproteobacteria bacterium]
MTDSHSLIRLFGKGAPPMGLGADKTWRPLRFFNIYRFILAALFILLYQIGDGTLPPPLGMVWPRLFYLTSIGYLGFSLLAMVFIARRRPPFSWQRNSHVLLDIAFITVLMYASGGVASGLGMLLVISIAYASMISTGRGPLLFAAIASMAVLGEQTLSTFILSGARVSYTQAGLLGITLFATAIIAHVLARRVRESEELAAQRGLDLANMAQLTEYTIQQMRTGVLVVDTDLRVRLINSAAWRLLGSPLVPTHSQLAHYSERLQQQLRHWQGEELRPGTTLLPERGSHELIAHYLPVGSGRQGGTLIFLEDASAATAQAQQLKLASLGRLTASIAHEIRNPLGAISHAAELLAEAPELTDADQRLTAIITTHTRRINAIIEDVLRLGRRDKSHAEQFALRPWLEEFTAEFLRGEGAEPGAMTWRCDEAGLQLYFDPNHLRQILTNLCHNGLRHAAGAGSPRVELVAGSSDEEWGYIDVIDHGPGIPEAQRGNIFEPFFTTESSGTGLGLYIARELAVCNRAQLRYEADKDITSRFRLHFAKQRITIE